MRNEIIPAELTDASVDEASLASMDCSDPPPFGGLTAGAPADVEIAPLRGNAAGSRSRALRAGALFVGGMAALALLATRRSRPRKARLPLVVEGLAVGACATQALDWLSIAIYEGQGTTTRSIENNARGHHHAYEVAVARMASGLGIALDEAQIRRWGWRFHKVFGAAGGIGYVAARRSSRRLGAGVGTLFGTAFFLVADELLMPALRLTPGPRSFPLATHARGAVSHIAYGVAAELAERALGR